MPNQSSPARTVRSRTTLVAAAAALSLSAVLLTACGGGSNSDPTTTQSIPPVLESSREAPPSVAVSDPTAVVEQSSQTTRMMNSVHIVLDVSDSIDSLPIQNLTGDVTNRPAVAAQGDGEFRINNNLSQSEFIVSEGNLYTKGDGGTEYTNMGPANRIYDPAVILDKDLGLANVIAKVQDPTSAGTEEINGVKAIKVEGTIASAELKPILPEIDKTQPTLPITLWIAAEAPYNLVQATITVDDGKVDIITSDWQKPFTIASPQQ